MAALPRFETPVSHAESSEKSSLSVTEPTPGLISGMAVYVGKAKCVGVADGGNQTMVGVGSGVCVVVGTGVAVGKVESSGRQATSRHVIARSEATKQSPNRREDCFVGLNLDHRRKSLIKKY